MTKTRPELVNLYRTSVPQAGRYEKLRLDKNENILGFPPKIIRQMLSGVSAHFLAAYPEPGPLYDKIAKRHDLKAENVLITAGSEMAIRYLFETYLNRGDEVVFLNPSFAMFDVYASICGAKKVLVGCGPDLRYGVDELIGKITPRTKIVAIANPNNPTGTVIEPADMRRIAGKAASVGALLLSDEAYYHFYKKTMLDDFGSYPNLVVTRTFSKACGLASVRLGYALAHAPVIAEIRKLQPIDHASAFALKLGEYIIDHEKLVWQYAKAVEAGKAYVAKEAAKLGVKAVMGHGNFMLLDVDDKRDAIAKEADRKGILLATHVRLPFDNNYIRITVGPIKQMKQFMAALKEAVKP